MQLIFLTCITDIMTWTMTKCSLLHSIRFKFMTLMMILFSLSGEFLMKSKQQAISTFTSSCQQHNHPLSVINPPSHPAFKAFMILLVTPNNHFDPSLLPRGKLNGTCRYAVTLSLCCRFRVKSKCLDKSSCRSCHHTWIANENAESPYAIMQS